MARTKGPLFSASASKQLGKSIIFKTKGGKTFVTRYNKPGGQNPHTPSAGQVDKRDSYWMALNIWNNFSDAEKEYWNDIAKESGKNISGWNHFLGLVVSDPDSYSNNAIFGEGRFGYKIFGKETKKQV